MGENIVIWDTKKEVTILPLQVFQEVKMSLVLSKTKINQLCSILRRNKDCIEPRIHDDIRKIYHLLYSEYETICVKFIHSITTEEKIYPTMPRRGRKSFKDT